MSTPTDLMDAFMGAQTTGSCEHAQAFAHELYAMLEAAHRRGYLAGVEAVRRAGRYTMDGGDPIVDGTVAGACDRAAAAAKGASDG